MDQLQLLTYTSETVLDKSPRVVIYQVLQKSFPSLLREEQPDKTPPRNRPQPKPARADVHRATQGETGSEFTRKTTESGPAGFIG